jgi:DNA end-binding protein Ku
MARPLWKGSISFGLVSIPVQLETAVREKTIHFHMLSKDGSCRLRRKLYCPETGREYDFGDTARGVEVAKDQYVLIDEAEIRKIKPDKGRAIEIDQFVKLDEIDPVYFATTYYVTPAEGNVKAYKLLHDSMARSGKVAVAHFVMRDRQNLAVLRVTEAGIVIHTMYYDDEVLSLKDSLPADLAKAKASPKEVEIAEQLIEAMTRPLDLSEYKDDYREKLAALVGRKKQGKKGVAVVEEEEEPPPKTINLMEALKRSLATSKPTQRAGSSHRRSKSA